MYSSYQYWNHPHLQMVKFVEINFTKSQFISAVDMVSETIYNFSIISFYKMQRSRNTIFKSCGVEKEIPQVTQSIPNRAFKPSAFQEGSGTWCCLLFTCEPHLSIIITQRKARFKKHEQMLLSYQRTAIGGDAGSFI